MINFKSFHCLAFTGDKRYHIKHYLFLNKSQHNQWLPCPKIRYRNLKSDSLLRSKQWRSQKLRTKQGQDSMDDVSSISWTIHCVTMVKDMSRVFGFRRSVFGRTKKKKNVSSPLGNTFFRKISVSCPPSPALARVEIFTPLLSKAWCKSQEFEEARPVRLRRYGVWSRPRGNGIHGFFWCGLDL